MAIPWSRIAWLEFPVLVALGSTSSAQAVRLNPPLAREVVGNVRHFVVSPDATRLVYSADQELEDDVELFSMPVAGGPSVKLSLDHPASFGNWDYEAAFTPDSAQVLYVRQGLWIVPASGGMAVRIDNGASDIIPEFFVSSDGLRVVYVSQTTLGARRLHSVSIGGGSVAVLHSDVNRFALSADATRVVYQRAGTPTLFSVPIAGGTSIQLDGSNRGVQSWVVSPDDARVVYVADQDTPQVLELYSTPLTVSAAVKLNPPLVAGGDVGGGSPDFVPKVSADSTRVVYTADQDLDGEIELFSVPIAGGTVVQLNAPLVSGGDVGINDFRLSPDSTRVAYRADQDVDGRGELYSVPISGGPVVPLSGPLAPGGQAYFPFQDVFTPDGSRLVFMAEATINDSSELFSVPLAGGPRVLLDGPLPSNGIHMDMGISPDSSRVVFARIFPLSPSNSWGELHSIPVTGGVSQRLDAPTGPFRQPAEARVLADSSAVIFLGNMELDATVELYRAPLAGGEMIELSPPLALGEATAGDVVDFRRSARGARVFYRADQEAEEVYELYALDLFDATPLKVNAPLGFGGDVTSFECARDGEFVLYLADQRSDETFELFGRALGAPEVLRISGELVEGGDVTGFRLSSNEARIVYCADQEEDERFELFTTTGGPAVRLHESLPTGWDVEPDFAIADEGHVVLRARAEATGTTRLLGVSLLTGSPFELSMPLAPGREVKGFQLSPDGLSVVFLVDDLQPARFELHRVPVQGGNPVRLNGALAAASGVIDFAIRGDSLGVVYRAFQDSATVLDLYSAPLHGGSSVRLNAPILQGFGVHEYLLTPDDGRVVFRAQDSTSPIGLFSVPTQGGVPVELASSPSANVRSIALALDGTRVAYESDGQIEAVPIAGGSATPLATGREPRIANESMLVFRAGNELRSVSLEGGRVKSVSGRAPSLASEIHAPIDAARDPVLFLANFDTDDAVELFAGFLTRPHRRNR